MPLILSQKSFRITCFEGKGTTANGSWRAKRRNTVPAPCVRACVRARASMTEPPRVLALSTRPRTHTRLRNVTNLFITLQLKCMCGSQCLNICHPASLNACVSEGKHFCLTSFDFAFFFLGPGNEPFRTESRDHSLS